MPRRSIGNRGRVRSRVGVRRRQPLRPQEEEDSSDLEAYPCDTEPTAGRRTTSRRSTERSRPTVINLDCADSSEESENSLSSPEKIPKDSFTLALTPSPRSYLDSSDIEEMERNTSAVMEDKTEKPGIYSDDSDVDLFAIDYNLKRDNALKAAYKEIQNIDQESSSKENLPKDVICENIVPATEDVDSTKRKLMDLDQLLSDCAVKLPKKKRVKKNKKLAKAQQQLKQASEELIKNKANISLNEDVIIMSGDEEEEEIESITLFIKWASNYIRLPVRQFQKFSTVYEEIADRFSLSVTQVLLCHNDKVISQSACPNDLKLKFGDIIEGGVQSQPTILEKEVQTKKIPGSIALKFQNSERKGTVTLYADKSTTMKELMQRYAEEKNIRVGNLYFSFDGEPLQPNDTPETLDLDGDECIDVFSK